MYISRYRQEKELKAGVASLVKDGVIACALLAVTWVLLNAYLLISHLIFN